MADARRFNVLVRWHCCRLSGWSLRMCSLGLKVARDRHGHASGACEGERFSQDLAERGGVRCSFGGYELTVGSSTTGSLRVGAALVVALEVGLVQLVEDRAGFGSIEESGILLMLRA